MVHVSGRAFLCMIYLSFICACFNYQPPKMWPIDYEDTLIEEYDKEMRREQGYDDRE